MEFYTADNLAPYATNLKLTESMLSYIASRFNTGEELSLITLAKEIQMKFSGDYVKDNLPSGRPRIYSDVCLLCFSLNEAGHGRLLQVDLTDCIYIGDIDV
ncbi:hypothetical protein SE116_11545 [Staphylococcus aureus]|uniref:hypothetical protein n=1 Tax=Staphylococcus aureus TaxID=1280 RepID=UPI00130327DF|nr:hypothetical protein [Staphylococcus aureus]WPF96940.1 hypothetical protein SE111_01005 [Staphylococcus aureus]WPF98902.1 hypothetical protein SE116_11545 [Staphylococcus aureus]HAR2858365.1 hypothetical protein [Staphylococcus aureus]HAR2942578.1 hypothetical protein [Staphylococcus aureus]